MVKTIRRRALLAEEGRWETLLEEMLADRSRQQEASSRAAGRVDDTGERAARLETLDQAARKVQGGCLRAAVQLPTGDGKAAETAETVRTIR